MKTIYRSVLATIILLLICCGAYPLVIYAVGNVLFHDKATGGIIERDGKAVGAKLIGQAFTKPEYFHGRPSAAGNGYDASSSSGSNLGPTNRKFADGLKANADALLKDNPTLKKGDIPPDLVTGSGSGLDPHVSPEGAMVQVDRVAQARKIGPDTVRELVRKHIEGPQLGIFGERVVNVLLLNLDLDRVAPIASK